MTRAVYDDGSRVTWEWTSRRHRMGHGLRALDPGAAPDRVSPGGRRAATRVLGWWIGLLFMLGATAFALGSFPYIADRADPGAVATTFVIGAVFFTSAAALQHLQTLRAGRSVAPGGAPSDRGALGPVAEPRRIDWWVTAVQLLGTIFFNITTIAALNEAVDTTQEQIARVWAPDALGSVCFLVASALAVLEVEHRRWWWPWGGETGRRIASLNMLGSIFFGISAVTSFILPDTGEVLNADATNAFTFLGAVCFLVGARLLAVEARSAPEPGPVP